MKEDRYIKEWKLYRYDAPFLLDGLVPYCHRAPLKQIIARTIRGSDNSDPPPA